MEQQVQTLSFIRVFWDQQPKWTVKGALITLPKICRASKNIFMEKDDYVARDIVLALFVNMKYFDLSAKNVVEVLLFPLKNEVIVEGIR